MGPPIFQPNSIPDYPMPYLLRFKKIILVNALTEEILLYRAITCGLKIKTFSNEHLMFFNGNDFSLPQ